MAFAPTAQNQVAVLSLSAVNVARAGRAVLNNLTFEAKKATATQIVGENGAGKSTLLRTLAGFIRPTSGDIIFKTDNGQILDVADMRAQHMHYLGHKLGIKPGFTVRDDLVFHQRLAGIDAHSNLADMLVQVGLEGFLSMPCGFLSAGQMKRLALARLLATPKQIWLLDEPFAALDKDGQALVGQLIQNHCAQDGLVFLVNHQTVDDKLDKALIGQTIELERLRQLSSPGSVVASDEEMFL